MRFQKALFLNVEIHFNLTLLSEDLGLSRYKHRLDLYFTSVLHEFDGVWLQVEEHLLEPLLIRVHDKVVLRQYLINRFQRRLSEEWHVIITLSFDRETDHVQAKLDILLVGW